MRRRSATGSAYPSLVCRQPRFRVDRTRRQPPPFHTDADAAASDKGTALAWIGQRIQQTGRVLPIYIGDDPTDEDAFDAVRFTGVGVAVPRGGLRSTDRRPIHIEWYRRSSEFLSRGGDWLTSALQASEEA